MYGLLHFYRRIFIFYNMEIIARVNEYILSPAAVAVLFFCGFFYLIKNRAFPFIAPKWIFCNLFKGNILSSLKAMTLALAGTLGVGNIVGVATAIHLGGPGAVFWMLVSAFVAMAVKYAEVYLALLWKKGGHGGAFYYIKYALGRPVTAVVFSLLCILSSFTVGNIIQTNSVALAFKDELGAPPILTGVIIAALSFMVICRGSRAISSFTLRLIPLLTAIYLIFSLIIIIWGRHLLPSILKEILRAAFSFSGVGGGIVGFFISGAVRYGVLRGIGSNEAGCGTSPIAHASAENASPEVQGCWGIFEVFADTVLMCTVTALVILISPQYINDYDGIALAIKAFESFYGNMAGVIISVSIFFFALSTVIAWSFYGSEAVYFLSKSKGLQKIYKTAYCIACPVGTVLGLDFVWELSDLSIALMTLINCSALISPGIKKDPPKVGPLTQIRL